MSNVLWFSDVSRGDVASVGGKNASLGEMVRELGGQGIAVPDGFATTADAFREYITHNELDAMIEARLGDLSARRASLAEVG
ncbi:MAG: PEP/pyruvate-binding domain-containing protein, partial [Pseudomonadota bacterium]